MRQTDYYYFRNDNAPVLRWKQMKNTLALWQKLIFHGVIRDLIIYLDSENCLKGSIKYENEAFQHLGSVLTNHDYSDWATTEISMT